MFHLLSSSKTPVTININIFNFSFDAIVTISEKLRRPEVELRSHIVITFYGYAHDPYDLEGISYYLAAIRDCFAKTGGTRILYLESAEYSQSVKPNNMQVKNSLGLTKTLMMALYQRGGLKIPIGDIDTYITNINLEGPQLALQRKHLPQDQFANFYLYRQLDLLRKDLPFVIDSEAHSDSTIVTIKILKAKADEYYNLAVALTSEGKADQAIEFVKKQHLTLIQIAKLREHDVKNDVIELVKSINKGGGAIFLPFGTQHIQIIYDLQRRFGKKGDIVFEKKFSPIEDDVLFSEVLNDENMFTLLTTKQFVFNRLMDILQNILKERGDIILFANNFVLISGKIKALLGNLSLVEVKAIMTSGDEGMKKFATGAAGYNVY